MIITPDKVARKYELLSFAADTVVTLTSATYTIDTTIKPTSILVGPVEGQAIRFTIHGVDPVVATKVGHLLAVADSVTIEGPKNVENFRAIREAAVAASVPVTYFY